VRLHNTVRPRGVSLRVKKNQYSFLVFFLLFSFGGRYGFGFGFKGLVVFGVKVFISGARAKIRQRRVPLLVF
jgi:hypothetical protein